MHNTYKIYKFTHITFDILLLSGPDLAALTVVKEAEYENVARDELESIFDVWGSANAILDGFFFEQLQVGEGYSYVVDAGSSVYLFEVSSTSTADKMRVKITKYK